MADESIAMWVLATLALATGVAAFLQYLRRPPATPATPRAPTATAAAKKGEEAKGASLEKQSVSEKKASAPKKADGQPKGKAAKTKHPLEYAVLKGHTDDVRGIDFSLDGRFLASVSVDRTLRLWYLSSFGEQNHRAVRINLDSDHASRVAFSPDSNYVLVSLAETGVIRVYKLGKKSSSTEYVDSSSVTVSREFPRAHTAELISLSVARNGRFVLGAFADTTLVLWSVKGDVLERLDSKQMNNNCAAVSPDGRFVACGGFTPDVKLWEVKFDKTGGYEKTVRAMELTGHTSGIHAVAFSLDATRAATLSKDGTWRLWDIDVNYELRQDPKLLSTGQCPAGAHPGRLALSPDASMVAAAVDGTLRLYSSADGTLLEEIRDAHGGAVDAIAFDVNADLIATASATERHVTVWQNTPILRIRLADLKSKLATATNDLYRQRLKQQIAETEAILSARQSAA